MDKDQNSLDSASRLNKKDKQRKANKVFNILIVAVSLLIVVVAATIILGDSGEPRTETASSENESSKHKDEKSSNDNEGTSEDASAEEENQDAEPATDAEAEEETEAEEDTDSGEPKVGEPVGTTQTGKKQSTSFEKGSADWNEMTTAMAAGTGIDPNNMTIWWLGNGGSPTTAKGTVSAKDGSQKYQVQLEWVDGQGWSPVKVEETN